MAARDSEAHKAAEALVDGKTSFWAPKLARGLEKLVEVMGTQDHEVRVMVAQGTESGFYALPNGLGSPKAGLLLLGGYCPDWRRRDPFACPTELNAGSGRPQPTITFGGNKTHFAELLVSGFVFDAAPSNKYDSTTNSLLKGSSRTHPLLGLSQAVVQHLVIADNVFLNSAHKAFDVYHSPASNDSVADIQNNFFLHNVIPMKVSPAGYRGFATRTVRLRNNSFVLNWPFNPDMEDDFPYEFDGNVAIDPKIPVALVDLQAADSSAVTAKKTVLNDIRGLFGINKDGGTVAIKKFAPRMGLDLANLPFPAAPETAAFGVQRQGIYNAE